MNISRYLIIHRDHQFDPNGINSGAEMATLFLCRFLAKEGHKVILAGQFTAQTEDGQGIEYWNLGENYDVAGILDRAKAGGSFHLISAGRALPLLLSQNDSACLTRSLISHDRSSNDTGINAKVLAKIADNIFCVSEAQKEFFIRDGVPAEKLTVINNGVDLNLFKASAHAQRDPNKLIFTGALVVDKGLHLLLEAYAALKQKHPALTLDVYGSAELWRRDEYLVPTDIENQLPGIKFHGKVSQEIISAAMQSAGLCVIPSIWFDPFPLVSIDAQATGCPVVAFDVGGLKEGIQDGLTGIVVKEITSGRLAEALDSILSNRQKWQSLSDNALKLSRPRFTWEKLVQTVNSAISTAANKRTKKLPKIALFSTWNQECGLATYANYLFSETEQEKLLILAEDTADRLTGADGPNVVRCWKKEGTDFNKIVSLITRFGAEALIFNFHNHHRLFPGRELSKFISDLQNAGVKVIAHLHNTFTLDESMKALMQKVDQVITLSQENRLEAIAIGAAPGKVTVIPHGVHIQNTGVNKNELRSKLGIPNSRTVVSCFGFVQQHKGVEELIRSVAYLRSKGMDAWGNILGGINHSDPNAAAYLVHLKNLAKELNIAGFINFADRFLSNKEVAENLGASDVVLMNYRSQHFEASGACSIAIGAGALVASSLAPPFMPFRDAVWHVTSGFDAPLSLELLLNNKQLAEEIKQKAKVYCEKYSWQNVFSMLVEKINLIPGKKKVPAQGKKTLKVLMQNRSNVFTQRGGDTILMEKTIAGLEKRGVQVKVDIEGKENPADYDIVHLINFVLSDLVKYFGEKAIEAGVPFVVTTLHEEISRFHNPSVLLAKNLIDYVKNGQSSSWYDKNKLDLKTVPACGDFDNSWAVQNAAVLIANGNEEATGLRRVYPGASNIQIVPVGYDIGAEGNAEDFYKEYGVKDFIFCVGRFESRKNQLMLLKALEDSDLTLVFAGGGFTYQADYAAAVRNFKRKGKTLVLDKLTPHMLASAYRAARVHVLPSWYELPGLVSLEAAYYGCNVVVTDYGTARSYFADQAFYCEPGSESSILHTVLAAYNCPPKAGLKEVSMKYTWENASEKTLETYKAALGGAPNANADAAESANVVQVFDLDSDVTRFQEMLERGEMAAKDKDLARAEKYLAEAEFINPNSVRLIRAKGAVALAQGQVDKAREYFERGIKLDSSNSRLYSGLGMCEMQLKNPEKAHGLFVKALEISPTELVAILQLLECSYVLNKYGDLEAVLRRYLQEFPSDSQMQYCLAGCLFKQNNLWAAKEIVDKLLLAEPGNLGAQQLRTAIEDSSRVQAPIETGIAFPTSEIVFDSTDREITDIEEAKRTKNYKEVEKRCKDKLQNANLRADQKEKLELLQSESEVLQGNTVEAEARYDSIIAANPSSARALCGKGAIAASRGDWQAAKQHFDRANSIDPKYDVAWAGLGIYALSVNEREKAWECFKTAIDINPENVRALLGIIELGYSLRRLDEVERVIGLYLEMHPLDLNFLYSLAGCYFAQDRLEEAKAEIDKILMFEADNKNAIELKALIAEKLGGKQAGVNA
jgi:glycosyltransferase involved in cell wall biosynthesis/Tfp pilus assembly protein PilF